MHSSIAIHRQVSGRSESKGWVPTFVSNNTKSQQLRTTTLDLSLFSHWGSVHSIVHESCMNSNPPTFNSSFSKRMCYTSLLLKRNRKLKWRKQLRDMRFFFGVSPHWREKSCTASTFPLLKTWRKIIISIRWSTKYLTCSRTYPSRHGF